MTSIVDEELLIELARPIVAEAAPAERELYPLLAAAYAQDPGRALERRSSADTLGFGLPELYVIITPIVIAAMNDAVQDLVRDALARGLRITKQGLRHLFGMADPPPGEPRLDLTDEQWARLHAIVLRVTIDGGIAEDQARLIADAVVGRGRREP